MYSIKGKVYSYKAVADIAEAILVKMDTTEGQVSAAAAASAEVLWVTTIQAKAAQSVAVQIDGIARVKIWGTVAVGDKLTATTGGVAITTTTAGDNSFWIAQQAWASGDYIPVLLRKNVIPA